VQSVVFSGSADVVAAGVLDMFFADEGSFTYPEKLIRCVCAHRVPLLLRFASFLCVLVIDS
jgi:hypothetical protein